MMINVFKPLPLIDITRAGSRTIREHNEADPGQHRLRRHGSYPLRRPFTSDRRTPARDRTLQRTLEPDSSTTQRVEARYTGSGGDVNGSRGRVHVYL